MSLLGLDIGSSSCKGVVFNALGEELARKTIAYSTVNMGPAMVEMDATVFRDAVFSIIRFLNQWATLDPIEAMAISSHGETIIGIDRNGAPTTQAIMNSDNRAVEEAAWWSETFGTKEIFAITGLPVHPMFSLNKIMWLKKNAPDVYENTDRFLSVGDYILTQLGLPAYTDYSLASRTMAFDIRDKQWSSRILRHCGVSKDKLPEPAPSGSVAGRLSQKVSRSLGLREGTVVALGGHDQPCGALGAGVINDGQVFDSAGTYECLAAVTDSPMNTLKSLSYSLNSYCHVVPGKFVTLAFFPAGLVSGWFAEEFFDHDFAAKENNILHKIAQHAPGPTGLCITPHFVGSCTPYWDVRAQGVMAGFTPGITKYHMYKAIYEGIACELHLNVKVLDKITGQFERMTISGGNSRAEFTVQLRADISGKQINILKNDEAVCLGAAFLAGIAVGAYADAEDAVNRIVKIEKTIVPNARHQSGYQKQLERYKTLYPSMEGFRQIKAY